MQINTYLFNNVKNLNFRSVDVSGWVVVAGVYGQAVVLVRTEPVQRVRPVGYYVLLVHDLAHHLRYLVVLSVKKSRLYNALQLHNLRIISGLSAFLIKLTRVKFLI